MKTNKPLLPFFLQILSGALLPLIFIGSVNGISSCNEPVVTDTVVSPGKGHASRTELLQIIEGGWVNREYAEVLERVHSPMFAAESGRPVQEMMFDVSNIKGDTVYNGTGRLNYLQGERFDVVFFDEGGVTKMKIDQGKSYQPEKPVYLDYTIRDSDTMLLLINSANNDTGWYHREFRDAPVKAGIPQNALEHHVNRVLFEGEWKSQDGQNVKFNANGTVNGWEKWTWFSVEIDKYGLDVQPDIMSAYNDRMGATYVYTLDNDRLTIYQYDSQTGDGTWTRGKVVAEFTRK